MKHKKLYLILILALVVIVLLGVIVGFWILKSSPASDGSDVPGLFEDPNAEDITDFPNDAGDGPENISIPGFEKMTIRANETTVGGNIFNPAHNQCYFVAVIALEDGREIFRSGLIAPGKAIYKLSLSEPLSEGTYNATLTYYCYSLDESRTPLNGATTHFILEVMP